jgi:nitroreductase
MDVIEAIHQRRSIRAYRPKCVERGLIEDVIWAAVQAPTPPVSGETPWAFCVIEGADRLAAYGARAKQYALDHQPEGRRWTWPDRLDFKVFWDAPALIPICGRSGNNESAFDCCRAGQNLMLAGHARGLETCWVGAPLPWLNSTGVAKELGVPAGFDPIVAMVLGYPAEKPAGNPRPRSVIHWGNSHASPPRGDA